MGLRREEVTDGSGCCGDSNGEGLKLSWYPVRTVGERGRQTDR